MKIDVLAKIDQFKSNEWLNKAENRFLDPFWTQFWVKSGYPPHFWSRTWKSMKTDHFQENPYFFNKIHTFSENRPKHENEQFVDVKNPTYIDIGNFCLLRMLNVQN